ncbi:MAG: rhamnose transport system permease protein, partial [Pseudonocardiales bacterium]|nr:rhamnose transport system permease protein [Pseudonocardiales bacterium]
MTRYFRELSVAAALALLVLVLAIFAPHFFSPQPLLSRLAAQTPALVAVIGMTLVIVCRQIDISIGSQFGMCAVIAGLLAAAGLPLAIVAAATMSA